MRQLSTLFLLLFLFPLLLIFPVSACTSGAFKATPYTLNQRLNPGAVFQGIRLRGVLQLASVPIDGIDLCGLSGLAWDEDDDILYAISDRGALFHLRPIFDAHDYLSGLQVLAVHSLKNPSGQPVSGPFRDSEGLAIRHGNNHIQNDSELIISFEGKPRLVRYSPTGQWRGALTLPLPLRHIINYRGGNQSLEAVAIDSHWGVVTGPEVALRNDPRSLIRIFNSKGKFWFYPLRNVPGSALVAMESLPDGSLLTLERAFVSVFRPFSISLRRTTLVASQTKVNKIVPLEVRDIAVFNSDQDWLLDNFEGLAWHRENRFFMISDDNCSSLQTTLLAYFELLPFPQKPP